MSNHGGGNYQGYSGPGKEIIQFAKCNVLSKGDTAKLFLSDLVSYFDAKSYPLIFLGVRPLLRL